MLAHVHQRAHRRREVLTEEMLERADVASTLESRLAAREALSAPGRLRAKDWRILVLATQGCGVIESARHLQCFVSTAANRLRAARLRFAALLARREGWTYHR